MSSPFSNFNGSGTTVPSGGPAFQAHSGFTNPTVTNDTEGLSRVNPNFQEPSTKKFGTGSGPEFVGENPNFQEPSTKLGAGSGPEFVGENPNFQESSTKKLGAGTGPGVVGENLNFQQPSTKKLGASSGPQFVGEKVHTEPPGLNEYDSGMLESTHIDPLGENSNKDDGWANAPNTHTTSGSTGPDTRATTEKGSHRTAPGFVAGVAKLAYGKVAGNETAKEHGREGIHGTK